MKYFIVYKRGTNAIQNLVIGKDERAVLDAMDLKLKGDLLRKDMWYKEVDKAGFAAAKKELKAEYDRLHDLYSKIVKLTEDTEEVAEDVVTEAKTVEIGSEVQLKNGALIQEVMKKGDSFKLKNTDLLTSRSKDPYKVVAKSGSAYIVQSVYNKYFSVHKDGIKDIASTKKNEAVSIRESDEIDDIMKFYQKIDDRRFWEDLKKADKSLFTKIKDIILKRAKK